MQPAIKSRQITDRSLVQMENIHRCRLFKSRDSWYEKAWLNYTFRDIKSIVALNKRIKLLKSRIQKLYEDRADGIIEDEFYFNKKNQWQNELDEILIKYNSTLRVNRTFLENAETLFELCKNAHSAYLRQTPSEKIKMLKLVCSNFLFDGKNIIAQAFPPFDVIIKKGYFKKLETAGIEPASKTDIIRHLRA